MFGFLNKEYEDIEPQEFKNKSEQQDAVILDVRREAEKAEGVIPGYVMMDISKPDFRKKLEKLDKDKTYLVYCRSGNRSGNACRIMKKMGFEECYNLQGGIHGWNAAFGRTQG